MTKDDFLKLLTIATIEFFILFNRSHYQQVDGVAMGSPLVPMLVNIFLGRKEVQWLNYCPAHYKPTYYRSYFDDRFVPFKDESHIELFKAYFNTQHSNMNFTSESEQDNAFPFLDAYVSRDQCCFTTSVYRKPTFSGVYTNYDSYIPMIYKTGLVSTMLLGPN